MGIAEQSWLVLHLLSVKRFGLVGSIVCAVHFQRYSSQKKQKWKIGVGIAFRYSQTDIVFEQTMKRQIVFDNLKIQTV